MMPVINGVVLAVSSSPGASIVAKVTVTMGLGLSCAWMARRSRAAVRHGLLGGAFAVALALPAASLLAPPVRIAVPVAAQGGTGLPLAGAIEGNPGDTLANAGAGAAAEIPRSYWLRSPGLLPPAGWIAGWMLGAVFFLMPMAAGLREVRRLRRSGLRWRHGQAVAEALARGAGIRRRVEVLLHEALPGPMTCGIVRPAIVLSADAQTWSAEDLNRAMVHELEHVRRRDWASHCVARAVCAMYWFHPLVWIAWRQLTLEAERCCDDAVLGHSEATAYADQLVGLARRLSWAAKSPLTAMANRAELATRVGAVLDMQQRRGRAGAFAVALTCAAAAALILTMSPLRMVAAPQSTAAPAAAAPGFDAVSVKLLSADGGGLHTHENTDPGRLSMIDTMHRLITRAYGITDGQLGGEPDWFKTHLFSIDAVTPAPASLEKMMLMLRGVLADRFQLKLREENRKLPVYVLEVAPGGPKFHELEPGEVHEREPEPRDIFAIRFTSIEGLMTSLNHVYGGRLSVDRPVVDRTHLTGKYNIFLRTQIDIQTDDSGQRIFQFPNLFHDIQAELGLRLLPEKIRMPYFVVAQAALPTPN